MEAGSEIVPDGNVWINEQVEEVRSGSASAEQTAFLRRDIEDVPRVRIGNRTASVEWDRLLPKAQAERKAQLSKLMEILSESSYIRNLERDLGNRVRRKLLESIWAPPTAWSLSWITVPSFCRDAMVQLVSSIIHFPVR
jgi:hypothetical protein